MFGKKSTNSSNDANANVRPSGTVPWSVRAELTIHRSADHNPISTPETESSPGVRMTYSFIPTPVTPSFTPTMAPYAFQRGNLRFTSTPPRSLIPVRTLQKPEDSARTDSGYNSNQSVAPPGDKRCKSTYSIVLAGNRNKTPETPPSRLPFPRPWSSYCQQQIPTKKIEEKEETSKQFTSHLCTQLSRLGSKVATATTDSRDVASQTTDIEAKLSPVAARRKVNRKTTPTGGTSPAGSYSRDETSDKDVSQYLLSCFTIFILK